MASILVIGPHPDDQELGVGGSMALWSRQGHRVTILDLTNGEPTPFGDPETRASEAEAARLALCPGAGEGAPIERIRLTMKNREVTHSIESRHAVAGVMRAVQADIVLCPFDQDAHPDHIACTRIVEDARFDAKLTRIEMPGSRGQPPVYPRWLWYYFASHLRAVPQPGFVMDVSPTMDRKIAAVECYASQFARNPRNRGIAEYVRTEAAYFGSKIGAAFGEPLFSKEPLRLKDLSSIF
jgi:bacillithiol biosynthesis deacetylase BshB1